MLSTTHLLADAREFGEIPPRHLDYAIVEAGLETGGGRVGHFVFQFGEGNTQSEFGGHVRQRVTGGLTGQCRTTRQTGVHFDDEIL